MSLKSRSAQYSYLLKVAEDCEEQTAVLYRDNESAIPLVDLLERNHLPYHIRNAELSFFTHRTVVDIQNIMRFTYDMKNADLFEFIYYKISTYLTKKMALEACEISREYNISVFTAIFGYLDLKPQTRKSLKALETHFNHMRYETPQKALYRIIYYMGYGEYMERAGVSDKKVFILKMIAGKEDTLQGFLTRMETLKEIIQNKTKEEDSYFILSTIHGSKGLEYDNVYLIDVQDGLFPEEVPKDLKYADREEIEMYEEERRLFYVGITRAKNNLYLFRTQEPSSFVKQLISKKKMAGNQKKAEIKNAMVIKNNVSAKSKKTDYFSEEEFQKYVSNLAEGLLVIHKKYGQGVISEMDDSNVTIVFENMEKSFNLKVLFNNGLLGIVS